MAHEHTQGGGAAIDVTLSRLIWDRLRQQGVRQQNPVGFSGQVPGNAGSCDPGTDDGNGGCQLRASAGITSA
jgi:hypothetical protein